MGQHIDRLTPLAPDLVAIWRGVDEDDVSGARELIGASAGPSSVARIVPQLAAIADVVLAILRDLPPSALAMPGGESDWNVAQAIGHLADARAGLALAASRAASGRWPEDASTVTPGVPGPADADREQLLHRVATSQRVVERSARAIAGHEADDCPLEHPMVGRLRCGEWLVFAGFHDLMHIAQLETLVARLGAAPGATPEAAR